MAYMERRRGCLGEEFTVSDIENSAKINSETLLAIGRTIMANE